jgi:hypothetical protein
VTLVFAASALLAYLNGEPGAVVTETLLVARGDSRRAHAVNLCEVYYHFLLVEDEQRAREALVDLEGTGLQSSDDIDHPMTAIRPSGTWSLARRPAANQHLWATVLRSPSRQE